LIAVFSVHSGLLAQSRPLSISGIYPHLTVYGIYGENGAHTQPGHEECGIGAIEPEPQFAKRLQIKPEFTVDNASVILNHRGKRLWLPKGSAAYDQPLETLWRWCIHFQPRLAHTGFG